MVADYCNVILFALMIKTPPMFINVEFETVILHVIQPVPGTQVEHAPDESVCVETSQVASPLEVQVQVIVVSVLGIAAEVYVSKGIIQYLFFVV